MARGVLHSLRSLTHYDTGAVFWLFGDLTIVEATSTKRAPIRSFSTLQALPFARKASAASGPQAWPDLAADLDWAAAPLMPNCAAAVTVHAALTPQIGALLVLGWEAPNDGASVPADALTEAASDLTTWLAMGEKEAQRAAAEHMWTPGDLDIAHVTDLVTGFQAILRRALAALGWESGGLLRIDRGKLISVALTNIDLGRLRKYAKGIEAAATGPNVSLPVLVAPAAAQNGPLVVTPVREQNETTRQVLVLGAPAGHHLTMQDLLTVRAVSAAVLQQLLTVRRETNAVERAALRQQVEALALELGHKLTFQEMFSVLARYLPQFIPASWLGLYRFPQPLTFGDEGRPSLYEASVDAARSLQPPLLPSLEAALETVDTSMPLTYLAGDMMPGGEQDSPILVVPVRIGDRPIAALLVAPATPEGFSEQHLRALGELSSSIALAIRYAQLFEQVERAKRDWEHTFDAITDTLAIVTSDYRIRRVNKTFAVDRGMRPGDLVGRHCYEALYGLDAPCRGCQIELALSGRVEVNLEIQARDDDRIYQASLFPIEDQPGKVDEVVEFAKDITLSRQLQQKLLETERLRSLGEMASGAAHDFNNTLAGVLGQVELLLQDVHDPVLKHGLQVIAQAAADGAATVRRIQNFARTERQQEAVPLDINRIIQDAVEVCAPRWRNQSERAGIAIQVAQELNAHSQVIGVPSELREVLVNIIFNAVEAMPRGGTITLRTGEDVRGVWVEVQDTGEGMSEEVRRHIFDPFFTTKGIANSGLGMSVVYGIIKLHRGDITIDSSPGRGTRMTILLPAAPETVAREPEEPAEPPRQTGWNILVVEDDPRLADVLARMLRIDAHQVTICTGGAEAIDLLGRQGFDLVLTDLGMPDVSGWDVVAAAREVHPRPGIVLVTGWGVALEEWETTNRGVDAVIPKPYTLSNIRTTLTTLADTLTIHSQTP